MSKIKRVYHPMFPDAELTQVDPVLGKGEIVFIENAIGEVDNYKVGDGINSYSSLPFRDVSLYPYTDVVTNNIGDIASGSIQSGRQTIDIIKDMISPYATPAVSNVRNNANGVNFLNTTIFEIGEILNAAISISFSVSNTSNLVIDPIEVESFGNFLEVNPYPNAAISLAPDGIIAPTLPTSYQIRVRALHTKGVTSYASTYIRFYSRFIWGASALSDLTTNQHALDLIANGGGQGVKQGYSGESFEITANGYGYVLIPSFLVSSPISWTEILDPNAPSSIGMINMGTITINNGTGTYNYDKFRSPFSNTGPIKLLST